MRVDRSRLGCRTSGLLSASCSPTMPCKANICRFRSPAARADVASSSMVCSAKSAGMSSTIAVMTSPIRRRSWGRLCHVAVMLVPCHDAAMMLLPCRLHDAAAMRLQYHCHVTAMSLPSRCQVAATLLPPACRCHVAATLLPPPRRCHVAAIPAMPVPCRRNVAAVPGRCIGTDVALLLPSYCHACCCQVTAMPLPCQCQVGNMSLPCCCRLAAAVSTLCRCPGRCVVERQRACPNVIPEQDMA